MDSEFKGCIEGNHKWKTIQWVSIGDNIDEVVRWCRVCGCIIVDQESDGRLLGQSLSIQGPKTYMLYQRSEDILSSTNTAKKEMGR